jgi:hypothetical protein
VNERRRTLLNSWRRVSAVRYEGTDGVHKYVVQRVDSDSERAWGVSVDGTPLRSESHRVVKRFIGCEAACWAAEEDAERRDKLTNKPTSTRQGEFSWAARAERRKALK